MRYFFNEYRAVELNALSNFRKHLIARQKAGKNEKERLIFTHKATVSVLKYLYL